MFQTTTFWGGTPGRGAGLRRMAVGIVSALWLTTASSAQAAPFVLSVSNDSANLGKESLASSDNTNFKRSELLLYDPSNNTSSIAFVGDENFRRSTDDGDAIDPIFLNRLNIDAVHGKPDQTFYLSVRPNNSTFQGLPAVGPGLLSFGGPDVVKFNPNADGGNGEAVLFFDGDAVFTSQGNRGDELDGLWVSPDENTMAVSVGGVGSTVKDALGVDHRVTSGDIVELMRTGPGAGDWVFSKILFDEDERLGSAANIDALHVCGPNDFCLAEGNIILSFDTSSGTRHLLDLAGAPIQLADFDGNLLTQTNGDPLTNFRKGDLVEFDPINFTARFYADLASSGGPNCFRNRQTGNAAENCDNRPNINAFSLPASRNGDPVPAPAPGTLAVFGFGLVLLARMSRRRRRRTF